ncbi:MULTISPECIES: hypothetical protein [unclassified Clostridium]|uniref:hypothetical protein n=1 Tax=unclassified Clostridium TaxID=2614128 RepID=UPI0029111B44|nr:hypothetical protein [Clostridium sp.]MDU5108546.1 hypothetical protein [Clostridium sp.]
MKKIMWGSVFVEFTVLIIILALVVLGKQVSDLIFNIVFLAAGVCLLSAIVIERKKHIENKLENNLKVQKSSIYVYIIVLIPLVIMLIINNIIMR